eukprot:TRINITY_DN64115_c0_g1_i1.p1 TRINITY_DN64115_c0_g1~~TRINITY_DN64115_c0_g1_i1.p1  ORF type:complete len:276 (+),score=37.59 TRINITY_DN64115_c0_g1_i1:209-1036(+)
MISAWECRQQTPEVRSVRVLVVGDSTVGKTSLVKTICSGGGDGFVAHGARLSERAWPSPHQWTCGGTVSLARESVEVGMRTTDVEVELLEVGGSRAYARARSVFYEDIDAVLLVYDVSNMMSYHNLVLWLFELCTAVRPPSRRFWDAGGGSGGVPEADGEQGVGPVMRQALFSGACPVLFVAHKCDLRPTPTRAQRAVLPRPQIPDRPPLLDRLLGGDAWGNWRGTDADIKLMHQLCDLVVQGRHSEASSKAQSFDFPLWRDFVRRALEAKEENE